MFKTLRLSLLAVLILPCLSVFSHPTNKAPDRPEQPGGFTSASSVWATASTMLLQWSEAKTGITGFTLYGGTAKGSLGKWADISADSGRYRALGLKNNTRYYWMVVAVLPGGGKDSSLVFSDSTHCNMQGVFSVGPGGYFSSIGQALDSIPLKGMTGNVVLELQKDYSSTVESFPLRFPRQTPCRQQDQIITLRPAANATGLTITTSGIGPLLVLDSVSKVIIDGRPGGTGSSGALSLTGPANLIYCRNASDNIFTYLTIQSTTNPVASAGLILMEGSLGRGCSNNIFSWCEMSAAPMSPMLPRILISSSGRPQSGVSNAGNQVLHSKLHDFNVMGIALREGNGGWVIRDNSFYSFFTISPDSTTVGMIAMNDVSTQLTDSITDNYFGGSEPGCKGGLLRIDYGDSCHLITLEHNAVVKNNHIQRIQIYRSSGLYEAVFTAILSGRYGYPRKVSITDNFFGGADAGDSLNIMNNNAQQPLQVLMILAVGSHGDTLTVTGNRMQNIALRSFRNFVVNMQAVNGGWFNTNISNNIIGDGAGGAGVINSTQGDLTGIAAYTSKMQLNNNRITGWHGHGTITGMTAGTDGIVGPELKSVSKNEIGNFRTDYADPTGKSNYDITGLILNKAFGVLVSGNYIHDLDGSENDPLARMVGISSIVGDTAQHIDGNIIRPLHFEPSTKPVRGTNYTAINISDGNPLVQNNMIEMGTDSIRRPIDPFGMSMNGIVTGGGNSTEIRNNSIYIWGKGIPSGLYSSSCLSIGGSYASPKVYNNIFVSRGPDQTPDTTLRRYMIYNSSYEGYCIFDNNIYYQDGKGAIFATDYFENRIIPLSFNDWKTIKGADVHSVFADPGFVDADGSDGQVDLHLSSFTPAEGKGDPKHSAALDIDGQTRSGLGPVDIGADAGNFTFVDVWRPEISVDSVPNHAAGTSQIITVRIKDDTDVDSVGVNGPTMWFRKSSPFPGNYNRVRGQLVSGNLKNGQWKFTADYAAAGVAVAAGDVFDCYFVARDKSAGLNVGYAPIANVNHSTPGVQDMLPYNVYHYKLTGKLPDTIYVGKGQAYTSLTNEGGIFQALDSASPNSKPTVLVITSDLLDENGKYSLNGSGNPRAYGTLQIITNTPVVKTIRNGEIWVNGDGLFRFIKRNNIVINGAVNGSGKYLHFLNKPLNVYVNKANLYFENDSNIVIQHVDIGSDVYTNSADNSFDVVLYQYVDNVLIDSNYFWYSSTGNAISTGIYGQMVTNAVFTNNEFVNTSRAGLEISYPGDSLVVRGNHVYYNSPKYNSYNTRYGIAINPFLTDQLEKAAGGHVISGNYIGGSAPFCGGAPWQFWGGVSDGGFIGIGMNASSLRTSHVYDNVIQNINLQSQSASTFFGIAVSGKVDVGGRGGNIIGNPSVPGDITNNGSGEGHSTVGIYFSGSDGGSITNNRVSNLAATSTLTGSVMGIQCVTNRTGGILVADNIIRNISGSGSINPVSTSYARTYISVAGIFLQSMFYSTTIRHNEIGKIYSRSVKPAAIAGGILELGVSAPVEISRNRIYGVESLSAGGLLAGMNLTGNAHTVFNNQVTITNGANTNNLMVAGIRDSTGGTDGKKAGSAYYYNSVYVGGTGSGSGTSYGAVFNTNYALAGVRNNLFYNDRVDAAGRQQTLSVNMANTAALWPNGGSDFNMMVSGDTTTGMGWYGMAASGLGAFRTVSGGDAASYLLPITSMKKDSLFMDLSKGDLNINPAYEQCWGLNGKGIAIKGITGDYDQESGVRSGSIADGATDIGSDEFVPTVAPPAMRVTGNHVPGGSDTLQYDGRTLVVINWGNGGILPELGNVSWYSGNWPNDTSNGQTIFLPRTLNGYWAIPATGGSGYSFDISFYYDSAILGKITDLSHIVINKRDPSKPGSWVTIPSVADAVLHRVTARGLTSFSEWTLTDSVANLMTGVKAFDLAVTGMLMDSSHVAAGSSLKVKVTIANKGNLDAPPDSVYFYISRSAQPTPAAGSVIVGRYRAAGVAVGGSAGPDNAVIDIPCDMAPGNYYLYVVVDGPGVILDGRRENNIQYSPIQITKGVAIGPAVDLALSYSGCNTHTVTVKAQATGGTGNLQYQWTVNDQIVDGAMADSLTLNDPAVGAKVVCTVVSSSACTIDQRQSRSVTINCTPTPTNDIAGLLYYRVGPNPTTGQGHIDMKLSLTKRVGYMIFNSQGQAVSILWVGYSLGNVRMNFDLSAALPGIYFLKVIIGDQHITQKILVVR